MAYTYTWSDLFNKFVKPAIKQAPVDALLISDMVSSKMATVLPWNPTVTTIAEGEIPLVDETQDYSVPPELYRLVDETMYLLRTDTDPNTAQPLNVVDSLHVDLLPRSVQACSCISHEAGVGQLRLEFAVKIPDGQTWEIRGNFQVNPTKITSVTQSCWFDDKYASVATAGLLAYAYKILDDPRAGTAQTRGDGGVVYTGQLGEFMAGLNSMKAAEDLGGGERVVPAEPLGTGRANELSIWGW